MQEDSAMYKNEIDSLRTKAYAGCVACVIFPPSCIACYSIAAGLLEGKYIPELKQQCADLQADGQEVLNVMQNLATQGTLIQNAAESQSNT